MAYAKALIHPPTRLRALPARWAIWVRALWILLFGLSVVTVAVSTIYAVRASYWSQPVIQQFNLDFQVTTDGKLIVVARYKAHSYSSERTVIARLNADGLA
jgi:hypothetical protein